MLRRLAYALVLRYPLLWRERYGGEVLALIDDSPVRVRDLGELVRGLFVERARALIEDADHPARAARILGAIRPLFVAVFMTSAWGAGTMLRQSFGVAHEAWAMVGLVVASAFGVTSALGNRRYRSLDPKDGYQPIYPAWVALACLPPFYVAIVLLGWTDWIVFAPDRELAFVRIFGWVLIWGGAIVDVSSAFWPGRRMLVAIARLSSADDQVSSARQWVAGCKDMIAKGVSSPLSDAEAHLARQVAQRDEAYEALQQLGYRARFQS